MIMVAANMKAYPLAGDAPAFLAFCISLGVIPESFIQMLPKRRGENHTPPMINWITAAKRTGRKDTSTVGTPIY